MAAEAFGTYLIVQLGTGAVMASIYTQSLTSLAQIASVWAVAVTVAIYGTASTSGAHLNPAITMALALYRHFSWRKVIPYSLAQLVGAGLGSAVNYMLYAQHIRAYEAAHGLVRSTAMASARAFGEYFTGVSAVTALLAEAARTFVLAFVIFALTHPSAQQRRRTSSLPSPQLVPVAIGITVGLIICVVAPVTQAGLNPARDLGPRLVAYLCGWRKVAFTGAWVYVLGPILGATAGGFVVDRVLLYDGKSSKSQPESVGSSDIVNG
jgi:glycerol uptake facilitator protein